MGKRTGTEPPHYVHGRHTPSTTPDVRASRPRPAGCTACGKPTWTRMGVRVAARGAPGLQPRDTHAARACPSSAASSSRKTAFWGTGGGWGPSPACSACHPLRRCWPCQAPLLRTRLQLQSPRLRQIERSCALVSDCSRSHAVPRLQDSRHRAGMRGTPPQCPGGWRRAHPATRPSTTAERLEVSIEEHQAS